MNKLFGNQGKMFTEVDKASLDVNNEKIEKLKELFPNIVSDGKVDWKTLKLILGENTTEEEERYRFTWSGKNKAVRETSIPTSSTLKPKKESSKNWDTTENVYIEGDNLEVLKVLQNSYNGKIKMIYIDPPYNTGNDFIYEDDFTISGAEAEKQEGLKDKKGATQTVDRLTKNSKDSAKYHTNWLNMMYPRLSIARDLLTDDGVIFISIDDNEVHNLRKVCDELFGIDNLLAQLIWNLTSGPQAGHFTRSHEYVLAYCKNKEKLDFFKDTSGGTIKHGALKKISSVNPASEVLFKKGKIRIEGEDKKFRGELGGSEKQFIKSEEMIFKNGLLDEDVVIEAGWAMKNQLLNWLEGKETFDSKGQRVLRFYFNSQGILFYEKERGTFHPKTVIPSEVGNTKSGSDEVKAIFGEKVMDFPKPSNLIQFLIKTVSQNNNDIILDFFSGSATTAHAVIKLNAEDNKNRKFIMVQIPEKTKEKSDAHKDKYNNICEIAKERIRRAGEKIVADNSGKDVSNLDIGFKVFKIDSSNFTEWDVSYEGMMKSVKKSAEGEITTYKTDRNHLDLVYEIMLKEGLQFTEVVKEVMIGSDIIYKIADGVMYIFLGKLNNQVIEAIVEMKKETQELFGLDNPSIILNEAYLDTEIKSNAKKNFEANGIIDIKTL